MTCRPLIACLAALLLTTLTAAAETLRWGRSGDAVTLDPHAAADSFTQQLVRNIYEPLVERAPDGSVSGKLAASWLSNANDPNLWTFNLRSAVFHDGTAFDAEDVVFSFNRARAEGSALAKALSDIIAIRALNPRSVSIRFADPTPVLPGVLSRIMIMDKEWTEANGAAVAQSPGEGDAPFTERNANGTGPYRLDSREPDVRTKLTANERYHSAQPAAAEIIYLPIANPAMQTTALSWGEIDVLQDVALADAERLAETDGIRVETVPSNTVLYLGYDLATTEADAAGDATGNPFANAAVRKAIELAINRSDVAARVDHGHGQPTALLAPQFVSGWSVGLAASASANPERARELLADAGYPEGFEVTLGVANGDEPAAEQIESMLESIGIRVEVVVRPQPAHDALIASGDSTFHLADYVASTYDSADILDWLVSGRDGYENASLASRVDALSAMSGGRDRDAAIATLWADAQEERIVIPLAERMIAHAMRGTVSVAVDPNNQTRFETITFGD
ncbi:MAG: ABC transporter substrate-binding protein [Rhizobiaceae bacterium]|nr:ABC transporter substrate-binding protein [Rhizobiaceae bacterium]